MIRILISLLILIFIVAPTQAQHFVFTSNTGSNAVIAIDVVNTPTILGASISAGDEIGVFTPDSLCVGAVTWNNANAVLTVWEDNPMTEAIDGILTGEEMSFRIWQASTNYEFKDVQVTYESGGVLNSSGAYATNGMYKLSSLSTTEGAQIPQLLLPINEAENVSLECELRWYKALFATSYRLQVAEDMNFTEVIVDSVITGDTTYNVESSLLNNLSTYYWRVLSSNEQSESDWSEVNSFTTVIALPLIPSNMFPEDGSIELPLDQTLSWSGCINSRTYKLQMSLTGDFTSHEVDIEELADTLYVCSGLIEDTTYYWRVKSCNAAGESDWSEICSFKTLTTTRAEGSDEFPRTFSLAQNYPNPFNPSTILSYSLPADCFVTLKVYDLSGKEVLTLINERKSSGDYTLKFDGANLSSGVYFYQIVAGKFVQTMKMILMK